MTTEEYKIEKKERDKKDKKASSIVFATMLICLAIAFIYIGVNG